MMDRPQKQRASSAHFLFFFTFNPNDPWRQFAIPFGACEFESGYRSHKALSLYTSQDRFKSSTFNSDLRTVTYKLQPMSNFKFRCLKSG